MAVASANYKYVLGPRRFLYLISDISQLNTNNHRTARKQP